MSVCQCHIAWYNVWYDVCGWVHGTMGQCHICVSCVWVGTWYDVSVSYMCQFHIAHHAILYTMCVGGYMVRCVWVGTMFVRQCHIEWHDVCEWVQCLCVSVV